MNNLTGYLLLSVVALCLGVVTFYSPQLISDHNTFLRGFVDQDLLGVLGFIVAITAASASNVHLELRRLESQYKFPDGFENTRREVKQGAFALLILFLLAFALVILKPIISTDCWVEALVNGAAILIVVWNVLVLIALLQLAFKVGPIDIDEE